MIAAPVPAGAPPPIGSVPRCAGPVRSRRPGPIARGILGPSSSCRGRSGPHRG